MKSRSGADDIVLMSDAVEQAQELLLRVEKECKSMFLNVDVDQLKNEVGEVILQALTENGDQDFLYFGSWCDKDRDIKTRKALAWKLLNEMDKIWKSKIDERLKIMLFRATTDDSLVRIPDMGTDSLRGESIEWHIHSDADVTTSKKSVMEG